MRLTAALLTSTVGVLLSSGGGVSEPELVAAFTLQSDGTTAGEYYRKASSETTFSGLFTHSVSEKLTMFDSTGTLVWAPHNLAPHSGDISTGWVATSASATDYRTLVAASGTSIFPRIVVASAATTNGATHTIQVKLTAVSHSYVQITGGASPQYANFDIGTGVLGTKSGASTASIVADGDGYLCTFSWIAASTNDRAVILLVETPSVVRYATWNPTGTETILVEKFRQYRSDLGGMADNPDTGDSYVPTTSAAVYLPRRNAYYYNGSSWVKGGVRFESAAATQLLHGTDSFATQTETVTAQAYTLQFQGTGSITLSGAHSATLNGTGANDLVSLTFTPSAGTLTLTPSGTVDYPMLAAGSTPSSYIPNTAASGTVTRAAETLSIAGADTPANTTAMSISMKGLMTYADTAAGSEVTFVRWYASANDNIEHTIYAAGAATGQFRTRQVTAGATDQVIGPNTSYSPGLNVPFNIASRHGSTSINGAVDGTALTADLTPTALADLSSTTLQLGQTFNGFISEFRMWGADIGDSGIAEVTSA